ncbi:MAG: DUF1080 domain-containing protein [Saprospiraceae bacterium]|nr:DUF1080 domain-containing protein [Saprospiraceae bacterium]
MKHLVFCLTLLSAFSMNAQLTDPTLTEVWHPVPRLVSTSLPGGVPSDAYVLFDGTNLEQWERDTVGGPAKWEVKDGILIVGMGTKDIRTRQKFGSCQLHLEFRTPTGVDRKGQDRGNSGVYFQERYEVQILDNFQNTTYSNGQCASIYKQHIPLVNACKAPGEWQSYDIIFTAPVFNADGIKISSGYFTVLQNGVLVQNHVEIKGTTEYRGWPKNLAHGKASIKLQDHGNPTSFRNIWVREL